MLDKKIVIMMYNNGKGFSKIASELHVSRQRIHQIVTNYKNTGKRSRENKYKVVGDYCAICGEDSVALHHLDKNNLNDDISNLLPVCKRCHYDIHRGEKRIDKRPPREYIPTRSYEWSLKYQHCIKCLSSNTKHKGKGLCINCYENERYHLKVDSE